MTKMEEYIKKKLDKMSLIYMSMTLIIALANHKKDFNAICHGHAVLLKIFDKAKHLIKSTCSKDIVKLVDKNELKDLPPYLNSFKIIEMYRKIIASTFFNFGFGDKKDILMNKMGIYLDEDSELPYLYIAQVLNRMKKYPEATNMVTFLKGLGNSTPAMLFMSELFLNAKKYDKVIDAYTVLLKMWQKNDNLKHKLDKLCSEVLK